MAREISLFQNFNNNKYVLLDSNNKVLYFFRSKNAALHIKNKIESKPYSEELKILTIKEYNKSIKK